MCPVVAVEGIIGAGKSTLCALIGRDLNLLYVPEPVDENPYLARFYADPKRWALHMQMWLVARRVKLILKAKENLGHWRGLLVDRSILGDRVFAELNHKLGNIDDDMWPIYDDFFTNMALVTPPPDVMVYLDVDIDAAMDAIASRGRDSEQTGVKREYQKRLKSAYDAMVSRVKNGSSDFDNWTLRTSVIHVEGYLSEAGVPRICEQIAMHIAAENHPIH
jgi:NADH dehydrogenase (ubiquinone) 1 alpha subcomplex subunit 10